MAMVVALNQIAADWPWVDREFTVFSDSMLVIKQLTGAWKLRSRKLIILNAKARELLASIERDGKKISLRHVRGHMGIPGNERADELAGLAVDDRVEPSPWVSELMAKEAAAPLEERGFEKLNELVTGVLVDHGHMTTPLGQSLDAATRTRLAHTGGLTAVRLLNMPALAITIGRGLSVLVAYTTRFCMTSGPGGADRAMELASINAAQALTEAGLKVLVVHKPHASGRWRTFKDLGWGDQNGDVPAVCAMASDLTVTKVHTDTKWAPFASLEGEWTPFITCLASMEERHDQSW